MARDWLSLAQKIEAAYPAAFGGVSADETLRLQLVPFAVDAMTEIQKIRRWSLAYGTGTVVTAPGTAVYAIPVGIDPLSHVYWLDSTGYPTEVMDYSAMQARFKFGEGAASQRGQPLYFSIEGRSVQIFPVPDNQGPTSGNYTLVFEGYQKLDSLPIVETTGTIAGAPSATLAVQSGPYLTTKGIANAGTGVSIRGAGYAQSAAVNDDWVTNWTAIAGNNVTLSVAAPTNVAAVQTFFNSQNWLITDYPKVLEFAVMREVATRLKDDYQKWEARYQHEIDLMIDADFDRVKTLELFLTFTAAERIPQLRYLDNFLGLDIRGGVL